MIYERFLFFFCFFSPLMLKEEYVHVRVLRADLLMVSYVEK